ncbi:MAG: YdeI/OmpD-associated family protein [Verrucomicrobia bacterium]|nr:YdeI/OmpD-associated family protein [Verrucomicrobiota bacterium]
MPAKDPRVDAYIARAADFARPILTHFRRLVHTACPDVVETMKWSFPHFDHRGILCSMAAFKQHCAFGFWKGELIFGKTAAADEAMGHLGRITSLADLPNDGALLGYIRKAAELNEAGVKKPQPLRTKVKKELVVPDWLLAALRKNKTALATFENFSYSHRKEYVEWLVEAKREETRVKRLAQALVWLAEGKSRNWKYERC